MGLITSKDIIYKMSFAKITSGLPEEAVATIRSPGDVEQDLNILDLIIGSRMESFLYPFAVVSIPLVNEVVNSELTGSGTSQRGYIFSLPSPAAQILGIFQTDKIPDLAYFLDSDPPIKQASRPFRDLYDGNVFVGVTEDEVDSLSVVFVDLKPDVSKFTPTLGAGFVEMLAAHLYSGFGSNSNMLYRFERKAKYFYDMSENIVLKNRQSYNRVLPTMLDVAYFANKDGQVK